MTVRWDDLRKWTQARIGLDRTGHSLSTKALLEFQLAHARARDAVHRPWDFTSLQKQLEATVVSTKVSSREEFLQRPDLGRQLREEESKKLRTRFPKPADLVFCVSDGLSSKAIDAHLLPFWEILSAELQAMKYSRYPLILVPYGRVAVSDEIGEALKAKLAIMLIGERPGLTAVDSLGIYLTYAPRQKTPDSRRNCISNLRPPEGLGYEAAARKLLFLIAESLRRQLSGVDLKEQSGVLPGQKKKSIQ